MAVSKHKILMCPPDFFTVEYVINPWMAGNEDSLSLERAKQQWQNLYEEISKKSNREYDLDDVVRRVASLTDKVSAQQLRDIAEDLIGSDSEVLSDKSLNNCEN